MKSNIVMIDCDFEMKKQYFDNALNSLKEVFTSVQSFCWGDAKK